MKRILAIVLGGVVAATVPTARLSGQMAAMPTIDQILEKYIAATGGRAALERVTSLTAKGTISIPDVNINGTIELYQKAPDMAATIVDLAGIGRQREGFDGTAGWDDNPQTGLRDKGGTELVETKRSAAFPRELKLKSLYKTLTVKGREKVGTSDAFVVEAVPAEGSPVRMFFDVDSGLQVRQIGTRETVQGPLEIEVTFSDFRVIDGLKHAFTIRQATSMFSAVIQLSEVKHNVAIDDAVFKKPK